MNIPKIIRQVPVKCGTNGQGWLASRTTTSTRASDGLPLHSPGLYCSSALPTHCPGRKPP
jgi:hypothetical protein